jgi:2,5-diamino-6-(ribosylamino)-4(3H)-pyrimidinone 5'-phosphate reductase
MLKREGLDSVMVEGGASVINSLLDARGTGDQAGGAFVDSVIVTIAPVYLGDQGPLVGPPRGADAGSDALVRLTDVKWQGMGADVVMCGRLSQQQCPK